MKRLRSPSAPSRSGARRTHPSTSVPDWSAAVALNEETFASRTTFDALNRRTVVEDALGHLTTSIYDKMKKGEFPRQVKLGRLSGWVEAEVEGWISQQIQSSRPQAVWSQ